ncbi:MAG: hypothetical protein OYH77_08345, partial [Pseudomonadota bacterium]|nr:hypothetical protein [Pseudomonadota bacterium]
MEAIISYQYHVAAPTVQSWQRWGHELELAKQQSSLEAKLSCPAGTMAVLQRAFSLQLNRHDGWDCPEQAAFGWAARYYKRGVKFSSYEGQSKVQFTQSYPNFADFDFVIVDSNVQPSGEQGHLRLETSETRKTLELVAVILARWRKMQRPKHWLIVGGGILLDVACFAAALSGAKTTLLPTTLTAMLDASVGGKTGVNFPPFGKNQVGAFHFSERVIINPTWLQTLPQRQLLAGAWEAVKHAIIAADIEMLNAWLTWSGDITALPDLQANLAVKIGIISTDAGETGLRRVLNFGHTLGHALEGVAHA